MGKKCKMRYIHSIKGFSLLELLITLGILGILMLTVTNLIVINLKVARRIQARSYAREETSYMLNLLKKDIRNADTIVQSGSGLSIARLDDGNSVYLKWYQKGKSIARSEGTTPTNLVEKFITPDDVEYDPDEFKIEIISGGAVGDNNTIVRIQLKASTAGMPDDQYIVKILAVSTRNYAFE